MLSQNGKVTNIFKQCMYKLHKIKSPQKRSTKDFGTVDGVLLCVIWAGNRGFALRIIALFL